MPRLLLFLLPLTQSYWPTLHGDTDCASASSTRGPSTLSAPLVGPPLLPTPVQKEAVAVLADRAGSIYAIAGGALSALDGRTLALRWSKPVSGLVQLQPDGTLYASGLGLMDGATGAQVYAGGTYSVSVASSAGDWVMGSAECQAAGQYGCFGLRRLSTGELIWAQDFGMASLSWLCTQQGRLVMAWCAAASPGCTLLTLDPLAKSFLPTYLPQLSGAQAVLQGLAWDDYLVVLMGLPQEPLPQVYMLYVSNDSREGAPAYAPLAFGPLAPPYMASFSGHLYITAFDPSSNVAYLYSYGIVSGQQEWATPLGDCGSVPFASLAVDSTGWVHASSSAGGLFVFSAEGVLQLAALAGERVFSPVALGSDGAMYAFSGTAVYAFFTPPGASPAAPLWHLYAELGAGALGALVLLALLARYYSGGWCCCCGCCARAGGSSTDDYSSSSSNGGSEGAYEFYSEPSDMLLIQDRPSTGFFSTSPSANGETRYMASSGSSLFGGGGSSSGDTMYKASSGASIFGGSDSFFGGPSYSASGGGNPWGGGSSSGGGGGGGTNPF